MFQEMRQEWQKMRQGRVPIVGLIVLVPLLYTVLFGAVYSKNAVTDIPLVILDEDQTTLSRKLVQVYADSEKFTIVHQTNREEDAEEVLQNGTALAALEIPVNFQKDIETGRQPTAAFAVNSANNVFGNVALLASWELNRTFSIAVGQKLLEGINILPGDAMDAAYPIHIGVRILGNPTAGFADFILAGLSANGAQIGLMITVTPLLTILLCQRKYAGESAGKVMLGRLVPYFAVSFPALLLSLRLSCGLFAVPMRGAWWQVALLSGSFLYFVLGVLMIFSVLSPDAVMAVQMPLFYIMPSILYSGLSWPMESMTAGTRLYAACMPMTYLAGTLRDVMLLGASPDFWLSTGRMLLYGTGCLLLAGGVFSWRWRRQGRSLPTESKTGDDSPCME